MGYGGDFLEFCAISIYSEAMHLVEGGDVFSFPDVYVAKVLFSWRDCSGVVGIVLFSLDSISEEKGGGGGGIGFY